MFKKFISLFVILFIQHFYIELEAKKNTDPIMGAYVSEFDNSQPNLAHAPFDKVNFYWIAFANPVMGNNNHAKMEWQSPPFVNNGPEIINLIHSKNPTAPIFISNLVYTTGPCTAFNQAADDPLFPTTLVKFLQQYPGVTGYDLDIEYPNCNVAEMIAHIAPVLHENHFKLSLSVPFGIGFYPQESIKIFKTYLDFLTLQSYWGGVEQAIQDWLQAGFKANQLIPGVSSEDHYNQASIDESASLVKQYQLAGIFNWRLDNDNRVNGEPQFNTTKRIWQNLH